MPDCNVSICRILVVTIALITLSYYTYEQRVVGQSNQSASQENVTTNLTPQQQRIQATIGGYVYGLTAFVVFVLALLRFRFYKSNVRAALGITIHILSLITWFQAYNEKFQLLFFDAAFFVLLPCFWILLTGRKKTVYQWKRRPKPRRQFSASVRDQVIRKQKH
jgi:hypothetical protein